MVWVVLWFLLVADTPAKVHQAYEVSDIETVQHPYISNEEKKHIEESLGEVKRIVSTPQSTDNAARWKCEWKTTFNTLDQDPDVSPGKIIWINAMEPKL